MMSLLVQHLVRFSHQKYLEVLLISVSTFLALFTRICAVDGKWNLQSENKLVWLVAYDIVVFNVSIMHAFIQVSRVVHKTLASGKHIILLNLLFYCIANLVCFFCIGLALFEDSSCMFRFGLSTMLFVFDWDLWGKFSRNLLLVLSKVSTSEELIKKECILAEEILFKSFTKMVIITVPYYLGVAEFSVLCQITCLAILVNSLTFITMLPAIINMQIHLYEKKYSSVNGRETQIYAETFLREIDELQSAKGQFLSPLFLSSISIHVFNLVMIVVDSDIQEFVKKNIIAVLPDTSSLIPEQVYMSVVIFMLAYKYLLHEMKKSIQHKPKFNNMANCNVQVPPPTTQHRIKETEDLVNLSNEEILQLCKEKKLALHSLEATLNDHKRAVEIRRSFVTAEIGKEADALDDLPYENYNYEKVYGVCCENVIGYCTVPLGVAGPLLLDNNKFYVPMATTEGCLVASTNRGCSALRASGGVFSYLIGDGMTRGPVVRMTSAREACLVREWIEEQDNFIILSEAFNQSSRFTELLEIKCAMAGKLLFLRFKASTGDAMGMNMVSKGTEHALKYLKIQFPSMEVVSLSGNYCTDKKPSAINWIDGRGKGVICEATIPGEIVRKTLKTNPEALIEVNISKNLIGSALAGSIGGQNAHAANIVAAIFIATGQDPAQTVVSSNCITVMELAGENMTDLYISCTMPSIETGTIGGGTSLPSQKSALKLLGLDEIRGMPGKNSQQLARVICGTVLAGELSLLSALASNHLVKSHMKLNRQSTPSLTGDKPTTTCPVL
eukprot:TCONS_00019329-protein